MSDDEKKKLDEYIEGLIVKNIQDLGISKALKNGKQNISWKDWTIGIATLLGMLTVIYFSANANTTSQCTAIELSSHKQINNEQFTNIEKRLDRIEDKLDKVIGRKQ